MMKKMYLFAGITGLAVFFLAFAPEDRILLVTTKYKRLIGDPGQICFDYNAIALKDPKTAEILEVSKTSKKVSVTYRAKNGFGAFGTDEFNCRLTNGEFTEFDKLYVSISARLYAGIAVNKEEFSKLTKDLDSSKGMDPDDLSNVQYLRKKFY
jgi:hypothetical protein